MKNGCGSSSSLLPNGRMSLVVALNMIIFLWWIEMELWVEVFRVVGVSGVGSVRVRGDDSDSDSEYSNAADDESKILERQVS